MFCGANVEEEIINEESMPKESTDGFDTNDELDIAVGKIVSDEEFSIREQRYPREQSPSKEYRQTRERNPIREDDYRRTYEGQRRPRPVEPRAGQKEIKKKGLKPLFILVPLLIIALIVAGWAFMGMQSTRAFNDAMEQGNRYLLTMNLEQAEAHFLRAVEISPREVEPYLLLADVYVLQDEVELAIDILEQGMEAVSESDREILEDKLEDVIQGVQPEIIQEVEETEEVGEVELVPHTPSVAYFNRILSEYQWAERGNFVCDFSQPWFRNELLRFDDSHLYYALIDMTGNGIPELFIVEIGNGNFDDYNIIGMYGIENGAIRPLWGSAQAGVFPFLENPFKPAGSRFAIHENGAITIITDTGIAYHEVTPTLQVMYTDGVGVNVDGVFIGHYLAIMGGGISEEEYQQRKAELEERFPPMENIEWLRLSTAEIDFGEGVDHDNPFAGILAEIESRTFSFSCNTYGEHLEMQTDGVFETSFWSASLLHSHENIVDFYSQGRFAVSEKIDDFTYTMVLLEYNSEFDWYLCWRGVQQNEEVFTLYLQGKDITEERKFDGHSTNAFHRLRIALGLDIVDSQNNLAHEFAIYEMPLSLPFHVLYVYTGEWFGVSYRSYHVNEMGHIISGSNVEPDLTDAEARHQRIMNGDFSDFAGRFTNGRGEIIYLNADGSIDNYLSRPSNPRDTLVPISFNEQRRVFNWRLEDHVAMVHLFDSGIPAPYFVTGSYEFGETSAERPRIIISNDVPHFEGIFFKD